jgi:hypothetical protein
MAAVGAAGKEPMMAGPDLPIMCTLPPNSMAERLTDLEALFAQGLTGLEREPLLLRLTFAVDAGQEIKVRELFAAEQKCCAFLTFAFERSEPGLVVSIAAPTGAGPALDGFQTLAERNASSAIVVQGWTG